MEMFPFVQAEQLKLHETCDLTERGVCVALCDYWIWLIKNAPDEKPDQRLGRLATNFAAIMGHQRHYGQLRAALGPREARKEVGHSLGTEYDTDKTVMVRLPFNTRAQQMQMFRKRMARDIGFPGSAATWSLRFSRGGGHAIAGFCGLTGRQPLMQMRLHVFDPNIGEYVGTFPELDGMLDDMLTKFPMYRTVESIRRASAE